MKIKDILKLSAQMTDNQAVIEYLENGASLTDEQTAKRETELLLRCLNIVLGELAVYYSVFINRETICSSNGVIAYDGLKENILETVNVYDEFGNKLSYKNEKLFLKTKPGTVVFEYTYLPQSFKIGDEVKFAFNTLTIGLIATGVVGEYVLISGDYQRGAVWLEKYKNSLNKIFLKKSFVSKERCFI